MGQKKQRRVGLRGERDRKYLRRVEESKEERKGILVRWVKMRSRRVMKAEKEVRNVNWGGGGFGRRAKEEIWVEER